MKPKTRPWRLKGCRTRPYPSKTQQKGHPMAQELKKVPHWVNDFQPVKWVMPLQQTRRRHLPSLQRTRSTYIPSSGLARVTGVTNSDTGPMSAWKGGPSTWQTMRLKTRCWSRLSRKIQILSKKENQPPAWSSSCYATKRTPTPYKHIRISAQDVR